MRSCILTEVDVYQQEVKIPEGYKYIDFRKPTGSELFLGITDHQPVKLTNLYRGDKGHDIRIIVARIPRKQIIFTATGEVRAPRPGDWYEAEHTFYGGRYSPQYQFTGGILLCGPDFPIESGTRKIFTRTESEI